MIAIFTWKTAKWHHLSCFFLFCPCVFFLLFTIKEMFFKGSAAIISHTAGESEKNTEISSILEWFCRKNCTVCLSQHVHILVMKTAHHENCWSTVHPEVTTWWLWTSCFLPFLLSVLPPVISLLQFCLFFPSLVISPPPSVNVCMYVHTHVVPSQASPGGCYWDEHSATTLPSDGQHKELHLSHFLSFFHN